MKFVNAMPTIAVVQNDYEALFKMCTEHPPEDWCIPMTHSQRVNLIIWLKKEHPQWKLRTHQLGDAYDPNYAGTKPYVIRFVARPAKLKEQQS